MKLRDFDLRIWNNETERYETNKPLISLLMIDVLTRTAHLNGNKFEIELWTGLCDKNGKKIYENDIVNRINDDKKVYTGCVNFRMHCGYALCDKANDDVGCRITQYDDLEIIGNIHENAELLVVKE